MPNIGDICKASSLGLSGHGLMQYCLCPSCSIPQWKRKSKVGTLCVKCSHKRTPDADVRRASELGYTINGKDYWLYRDTCPSCYSTLWHRKDALGKECSACSQKNRYRHTGPENPRWVNGSRLRKDGYLTIVLQPTDPLFAMCHHRTHEVLAHRVVMARALGRPLKPWEIIHHKNHKRSDNRLENLELISAQHIHQSIGIEDQILQRLSQLESQVTNLSIQLSLCQVMLDSHGEYGNPELAEANKPRASVETLHQPPLKNIEGEEKVQPCEKLQDEAESRTFSVLPLD